MENKQTYEEKLEMMLVGIRSAYLAGDTEAARAWQDRVEKGLADFLRDDRAEQYQKGAENGKAIGEYNGKSSLKYEIEKMNQPVPNGSKKGSVRWTSFYEGVHAHLVKIKDL